MGHPAYFLTTINAETAGLHSYPTNGLQDGIDTAIMFWHT